MVEHIRRFIVEGVLEPGKKLNERELCETLGISRTPLREALKVLAAEGLIEISPNRGASVSKMSEAEAARDLRTDERSRGFLGRTRVPSE